jgi:hypothetical protein
MAVDVTDDEQALSVSFVAARDRRFLDVVAVPPYAFMTIWSRCYDESQYRESIYKIVPWT